MRHPASVRSVCLALAGSGLFALAAHASEPQFPGRVVPAVPFAAEEAAAPLETDDEFDAPPAALPRPLEAHPTQPLQRPALAQQTKTGAAAGSAAPSTLRGIGQWFLRIPALLTGPNLTIAGTTMLCIAGLLAGLALVLSSPPVKAARTNDEEPANAKTSPAAADPPIPAAAAQIISQLLRGGLPVESEPVYFPKGARIFGRAVANTRYRVDAPHAAREPHFPVAAPAETSQPAWGDAVWISVRTLEGAEGPHFKTQPAAAARQKPQPERSLT